MVKFACLVAFVAAIPHTKTKNFFPGEGSWQTYPQQGSPWMDFSPQGSPWTDVPQQGNPWEEYPQHDPKPTRPKPENPQHGSPAPDINDMLKQVNRIRAKTGARALRINDKLMTAAQSHSIDQANSRQMSHTGSDGSDIATRAARVQYNYRAIAENVAYNQRSVSEVMMSWINSPGHYANLINPAYKDFGTGMVDYYWTQNFGSTQ